MNYAIQIGRYLEAFTDAFPRLTPAERFAFDEWRAQLQSRRDSDWPGWARYIGSRPRPHRLRLEKSA